MTNYPYAEYGREYYQKNKKRILERTREYRKIKQARWYQKNKEKLSAIAKERARQHRIAKKAAEYLRQEKPGVSSIRDISLDI